MSYIRGRGREKQDICYSVIDEEIIRGGDDRRTDDLVNFVEFLLPFSLFNGNVDCSGHSTNFQIDCVI